MKRLLGLAAIVAGLGLSASSASAQCSDISVAEMNWGSAAIAANVDKIVLEAGYDCKVTLVSGDTVATFETMLNEGSPDMAPEFWVNAVRERVDAGIGQNRLMLGAEILADGAIEGWWIPKFVFDAHPKIRTVEDALAAPELFPSADPARGAVHNCPPGWACHASTANLFRALGAGDKGFHMVESSSPAELEGSIVAAFENKTGWLGYYWAPTAILGKYEMVKLSFGVAFDKAEWSACTAVPDCPNPRVNSYPTSRAFTLLSRGFADKAAVTMDYVRTRKWSNETVSALLAWQEENKASNEETARHFLETGEKIWSEWVTPAVAEKIKAAL
jgi:glycine betaine/proline transport system substrate-binding protein